MKKILYTALLTWLVLNAPWRMYGLVAQSFVVSPGLTRVTDGTNHYWEARDLQSRLEDLGWTVSYVPTIAHGKAYGMTVREQGVRAIFIESALSWNARLAILAHEAGHTMQSDNLEDDQAEVFAEVVATLMSHDGLREHARYLSTRKWTLLEMTLTEWPSMYHAAAVLEDR